VADFSSVATSVVRPRRRRLFYLDFIRAFATILIVITHFNNPYLLGHPIFVYSPFHIYVGSLGVSLFLIISGAALMYVHGDDERLNFKRFYFKRFKTIYPMFWIAFIFANAYLLLMGRGIVTSAAPRWRIIFSALGMDGLIASMQYQTFYTLGEWFLGFIIIFYVAFPLLRVGVNKKPVLTAVIVVALYTATLILPTPLPNIPRSVLLTTRLPELTFGMYFIKYIKKVKWPVLLASIALLVLQQATGFLNSLQAPGSEDFATTLVGIAAFAVLVWVAQYLDHRPVRVPVASIAKYSYSIFLVHHVVISEVFLNVDYVHLNGMRAYLVFAATCLIIATLSVALFKLDKKTSAYVGNMFVGEKQQPEASVVAS
jgi:peptidoglycan/LPS O-acetylase OafA/YrhL